MNENYCNNCGKQGHLYHQCKMPITSIGIIVFRYNKNATDPSEKIDYLMICRKDTLGFIDFMRGKYSIYNKGYIANMLKQMTTIEKRRLIELDFDTLWIDIWKNEMISNQYKVEEILSREKYNTLKKGITSKDEFYSLQSMLDELNHIEIWEEPEWGFPKGRRNYLEKDYECAIREFGEETGSDITKLKNIHNILPFEEIFTGSNYKSYKHKYFVSFIPYEDSIKIENFETSEVSKMEWHSYSECLDLIRPYNLEKKRLITNVNNALTKYRLFFL